MSAYLTKNGYECEIHTEYPFGKPKKMTDRERWAEEVKEYHKQFDGYSITISYHTNYYGGKTTVKVWIDSKELGPAKQQFHYWRAPSISFFATGYSDWEALEKKIKEEIVPALKSWAIETI